MNGKAPNNNFLGFLSSKATIKLCSKNNIAISSYLLPIIWCA